MPLVFVLDFRFGSLAALVFDLPTDQVCRRAQPLSPGLAPHFSLPWGHLGPHSCVNLCGVNGCPDVSDLTRNSCNISE